MQVAEYENELQQESYVRFVAHFTCLLLAS